MKIQVFILLAFVVPIFSLAQSNNEAVNFERFKVENQHFKKAQDIKVAALKERIHSIEKSISCIQNAKNNEAIMECEIKQKQETEDLTKAQRAKLEELKILESKLNK